MSENDADYHALAGWLFRPSTLTDIESDQNLCSKKVMLLSIKICQYIWHEKAEKISLYDIFAQNKKAVYNWRPLDRSVCYSALILKWVSLQNNTVQVSHNFSSTLNLKIKDFTSSREVTKNWFTLHKSIAIIFHSKMRNFKNFLTKIFTTAKMTRVADETGVGCYYSTVCSTIKAKWQLSLQLRYLCLFWPYYSI